MADSESESDGSDATSCPGCGETLPGGARFCPHCESALDADGDVVDLSELDGRFGPESGAEFLSVDESGLRRASGRVRALAGLAVAVPLAPLVLFLASTVVSLSVWSAAAVFLVGWLAAGAYLSRARVPAEAFGRSCYLIAGGTVLVPVGLRFGDAGLSAGESAVPLGSVAVGALALACVAALLGRYVTDQARGRVTGENRAFEPARED